MGSMLFLSYFDFFFFIEEENLVTPNKSLPLMCNGSMSKSEAIILSSFFMYLFWSHDVYDDDDGLSIYIHHFSFPFILFSSLTCLCSYAWKWEHNFKVWFLHLLNVKSRASLLAIRRYR